MKNLGIAAAVAISLLMGVVFAVVAAIWIFPESVVSVAARAARSRGLDLESGRIRGTPATGWTIEGFGLEGPAFTVSARRLRIDIDWTATLIGRPAFDRAWADGLRIGISPRSPASAHEKTARKKGPSLIAVHDLRVSDGAFEWKKDKAKPVRLEEIEIVGALSADEAKVRRLGLRAMDNRIRASGRYRLSDSSGEAIAKIPGCLRLGNVTERRCVRELTLQASMARNQLEIKRLAAWVQSSTVTGRGNFQLSPFRGDFALASTGPFKMNAAFQADGRRWEARVRAAKESSRLDGSAAIDLATEEWRGTLVALGVPADLVPGLVPNLGAINGRLEARGRGKQPAKMSGGGRLEIAASNGPRLAGEFKMSDGNLRAAVKVSSGGAEGKLAARWNFERQSGNADVDLNINAAVAEWLPVSAAGTLNASIRGRWPEIAWTLNADLGRIATPSLFIEKLTLDGGGPRLSPPTGRLAASVGQIRRGEREQLDAASFRVNGALARHKFNFEISRDQASVRAAGTGGLDSGTWTGRFHRLGAALGQNWTATVPFVVSGGAGGLSVSNLRLVTDGGSIRLDGGLSNGRIRNTRLLARGVRLGGLAKILGSQMSVEGVASIEATAAGPVKRPLARGTARVAGLSIGERPAGDVSATVRSEKGRLMIEELNLVTPGGRIFADGDVPLSLAGRRVPPFRLHVRTNGLDPAALPVPLGSVRFENAILKADLTASGRGGKFSSEGQLEFNAARIGTEEKKGPALTDVRLKLVSEGETLRVAEATARGGDGSMTLSGALKTSSADLALHADDFEIRHPAGVFARIDSDLSLKGPWQAPHLDGKIDIDEGEIKPAKREKKKEPRKPARRRVKSPEGSPLSARVDVVFDRDVWYKDGQSSIELKGDLEIRKEAADPAILFGSVETIRGTYIFYGRDFEIEEGRVVFTGVSPPNPTLAVRALHLNESNNVKVWIDAGGTLRDPRIKLSSQPPMEETDIIAVLVTGAPLGAERPGAGTEAAARVMAANYLANQVRQRVHDKFAVDVLRFKLDEGGETDVTIGENVTEELYVSYGQTLGTDAERRLTAEYALTPRLSLHGTTSSVGRYVLDLLFRFGFY